MAWVTDLEEAVQDVAAALPVLAEGGKAAAQADLALRRAMFKLESCEQGHEKLGPAPSLRLGLVAEQLIAACSNLAEGAMSFWAASNPDAAKDDRDWSAKKWEEAWKQARKLVREGARELVVFSPANQVTLPVKAAAKPATRIDPTYGKAATKLVGKPVEVRCWSRGDWQKLIRRMRTFTAGRVPADAAGFVGFGDDKIHLSQEVCNGLARLVYADERPTGGSAALEIAFAVGTLAHEARHVAGTLNEAAATCYGMQLIPRTGRLLGAEASYARVLAQLFWTDAYPLLQPEYRSDECRDSGVMDAAPKRGEWP